MTDYKLLARDIWYGLRLNMIAPNWDQETPIANLAKWLDDDRSEALTRAVALYRETEHG